MIHTLTLVYGQGKGLRKSLDLHCQEYPHNEKLASIAAPCNSTKPVNNRWSKISDNFRSAAAAAIRLIDSSSHKFGSSFLHALLN